MEGKIWQPSAGGDHFEVAVRGRGRARVSDTSRGKVTPEPSRVLVGRGSGRGSTSSADVRFSASMASKPGRGGRGREDSEADHGDLSPLPVAGPRLILGAKPLSTDVSTQPTAGDAAPAMTGSAGRTAAVVKMLSERLTLSGDLVQRVLTDSSDFLVVAALGTQGAGKSSLLNELAGGGPAGAAGSRGPRRPFHLQTAEMVLDGSHMTVGVDMYVTSDRLILLDCQPLLSPSVVIDMLLEAAPVPPAYVAYDHMMEMQSIQLAAWALSVANLVLVVQDDVFSADLLHLLRVADSVRRTCGALYSSQLDTDAATTASGDKPARNIADCDVSGSNGDETDEDRCAQVAFVYNKTDDGDMTAMTAAALARLLEGCLAHTALLPQPLLSCDVCPTLSAGPTPATRQPDGPTAEATDASLRESCGAETGRVWPLSGPTEIGCSLYLLPRDERLDFSEDSLTARPPYHVYVQDLVSQLLSLPQRRFARTMTEREWATSAGQVWEELAASPQLAELANALSSR